MGQTWRATAKRSESFRFFIPRKSQIRQNIVINLSFLAHIRKSLYSWDPGTVINNMFLDHVTLSKASLHTNTKHSSSDTMKWPVSKRGYNRS
ncbi:hypothetical protein AVEN_99895-1 [Araneus ventricosus]|uniref:Uncharacterized protein n=1 Tax=Araneus ventricosus TaxID=182803 RepID=A0A4Y2SR66_ARAVE|nr:hypothetical protein AVEN_99895-1 [Araneus ventricosus]